MTSVESKVQGTNRTSGQDPPPLRASKEHTKIADAKFKSTIQFPDALSLIQFFNASLLAPHSYSPRS